MVKKNFTVSDLPDTEKPRERLKKHGAEYLSLQELFAVILGRGISGESVMVTSQKIVSMFGSIKSVGEASLEELQTIKGIGPAKSAQIRAVCELARRFIIEKNVIDNPVKNKIFNCPEDIFTLIKNKLTNYAKEHFFVISFDTRNHIIAIDNVSVGILNASLVHPRETFESAIKRHAAKIIIAHNHPSGDVQPSEDDIKVTKDLVEAGKIIGIEVIDHIIVTRNLYFSFKSKSLI